MPVYARRKNDSSPNTPLDSDEIEDLKALESRPIVYDEDCPEYTYEELVKMYEVSEEWRAERERKKAKAHTESVGVA